MEGKRIILVYGTVLLPLEEGNTAKYYNNGQWKETEKITKIIEINDDFIKFETERLKYYIRYQKAEAGIVCVAA